MDEEQEVLQEFSTKCNHEWILEGVNPDNGLFSYICRKCSSGIQVAKKLEA